MNRPTRTATQGPAGAEPNSAFRVLPDKIDRLSQADCLREGTCAIGGVGAKGIFSYPTSLKSTLPIQVLVIGLLLILSLCILQFETRGQLPKGMQRRRLAGGGKDNEDAGEEPGPPSPDYKELCHLLGPWNPSSPLPGEPRSSPVLVESYFTSLDQTAGQSSAQIPAAVAAPIAVPPPREPQPAEPMAGGKRPLDEGNSGEEATPGPSWKVARLSASSAPGQGSSSERLLAAAMSGALPSSGSLSSTLSGTAAGVVPPQVLESDPASQHPFVRLPKLAPGVTPRAFSPSAMKNPEIGAHNYLDMLYHMRELLRKRWLNKVDAEELVSGAEFLANHAYHWMRSQVQGIRPGLATPRLARRFLLMHILYRASQALLQNWHLEAWWKELLDKIPHIYDYDVESHPRASASLGELGNNLSAALQAFRSGGALSNNIIVNLLRGVFCMADSPMREVEWEPWRQDDKDASGRL
ncbi:hypothetical protein ACSSS7_002678 [Eimeria intestinalis]